MLGSKRAVDAGAAKQHAQLDLTTQKVLTELLGVGYAATKATDIRVSDKLRALELLAKHLGLLTEQVDHKHVTLYGRYTVIRETQGVQTLAPWTLRRRIVVQRRHI